RILASPTAVTKVGVLPAVAPSYALWYKGARFPRPQEVRSMKISFSLTDVSKRLTIVPALFLLLVVGCGQKSNEPSTNADGKTGEASKQASKPGLVDRLSNKAITVPAGTVITVRTKEALGSKISSSGQTFTAS